ncbi:endonuclease/exonuclease/phosphatase family protein [Cellulomonas sp. HZM]|uniref:endonuclease/exonuclease/phosphatase family protein n=1 Tax=Cellulomonas sp. HZM TaxID=1454010 RepID=UPI0004930FC7|nr:endonuclease/exonuclease/phosphatase family protein [Cellulomonas sp. HZM]
MSTTAPPDEPREPTRPAESQLPPDAGTPTRVWLAAALTVAVVEAIRMSGPLLDRAFGVGTLDAALTALGTYAGAGVLAGVALVASRARQGVPTGRTVLAAAGLLAVLRLVTQGLGGSALYVVGLVTVAAAVAAFTLGVAFVAGRDGGGRQAATGIVLGTTVSVSVQLVLGTWDAVWRDGWSGWLVGALVAIAPLTPVRYLLRAPAASGRPRRTWALGPFLALAAMIVANPAFAASQTGMALGVVGLATVLAGSVGVWVLLRPTTPPGAVRVAAAVLLVGAVAAAMWWTGAAALVALLVLQAVVGVVLTSALSARRPAPLGTWRTVVATAVAGIGAIAVLLVYMLDYDVPLPFDNAWVVVAAAVALALAGLRLRTPGAEPRASAADRIPARVNTVRLMLGPPVLLALVGLVPSTTSTTGAYVPARASNAAPTVMTWNLHYGVSPLTAVDLEGIARTIAEEHPDVVALQEVERGWVMGGGTDVATWLAHRLGMTVRFAPAADRQFGNAILSRSALADVAVHPLPYGAGPQDRSAISATVVTARGQSLRVTSVHLQHRAENTPTRIEQLTALLADEPVTGPSVLAGDLNSTPGSPEITMLTDAGWTSAVDAAGDGGALTSPSTEPVERIDWILGQQVTFSDARVPTEPRESDHLPVVAVVTPAP